MTKHQWIARDADHIPRVYGTGPTDEVAEQRCMEEAQEYIKRRPDRAPLVLERTTGR